MRFLAILFLLAASAWLLGMDGSATAQADKAAGTRAEQLADAKDKFKQAIPGVAKEFQAATSDAERAAAIDKLVPIWESAVKLADGQDEVAKEALTWVLDSTTGVPLTAKRLALIESLPQTRAAKTTPALAGRALFTLATTYQEQADKSASPKQAAALSGKAEAIFERVAKEHADVPSRTEGTLGKAAERALHELRNLSVGRQVPDVEGTDLEGKKIKLSSYKGKVVVLDIWATWCPPCRAMIPHERELVKRLEKKPFVLISVSADAELATLKKFIDKEPMPWVHWHNGAKGGILETFNVRFYPTIYVLDAKGTIRFKNVRGKAMDEAVESLLKEADAKSP